MDLSYSDIAKMIDHSLLNPAFSVSDLESGCLEAIQYNVASVCILPYYLARCAEILSGTSVRAGTTVGFPHGGHTTRTKVEEARQALEDGGQELDAVINISKVLSGDWDYVTHELREIIDLTHSHGQKVKVIFENVYLQDDQKIRLCEICGDLRADWVKTSTGYASGGATVEDLKLMRKHSPPHVQVKAAGGVRDLDTFLLVRSLGVTRVGASRTRQILQEFENRFGRESRK